MLNTRNIIYALLGLVMIYIAITLPFFTHETVLLLFDRVTQSIESDDGGKLIFSMFFYILHQLVMCSLIYLGALCIARAIFKRFSRITFQVFYAFLVIVTLLVINLVHKDHYSFVLHLLILSVTLFVLNVVPQHRYRIFPLSVVIIQIILTFEWLNLIPSLSTLGFGSDDLAISIKVADGFLTNNKLLNSVSTIFCLLFLVLTLLFTLLIYIFNKQINTLNKYQEQERELKDARIAILQSRVFKEIHTLVHDLKTPLVSVEGLTSLMSMTATNGKIKEYSERIDSSVQKMKEMITEILQADVRKEIEIKELIDYTASHIELTDSPINFTTDVEPNLPKIKVNKIRFARALSNLIENSIMAIGSESGEILLEAKKHGNTIELSVTDDGPGIRSEVLQQIWTEGFSTKESTGLGLPFVKVVVKQHNGEISVNSDKDGTIVKIMLPIERRDVKDD